MAKATSKANTPKINVQHEYISVDLGNSRRLTASFSGEKASGSIPESVFKAWSLMVQGKNPEFPKAPLLDNIKAFVAKIDTIWPEWNKAPKAFEVGQTVKLDFGKRKGIHEGKIEKQNRTTYTVRFATMGLVTVSADMLAELN